MSRITSFKEDARNQLKTGVDHLANAVRVTLGPKGRNVVIGRGAGNPVITKDGVTVAREVVMNDVTENMGVQMVRDVANRTASGVGDGTSTSVILAQAIVEEGFKAVKSESNPIDINRGINKAVNNVVDHIKNISKKIEDKSDEILQIATISANNDKEIGGIIKEAMDAVGRDGIIPIEESRTHKTHLEVAEGLEFDNGYLSPHFVNKPGKVELENPAIFFYDHTMSTINEVGPIADLAVKQGKPIVFIVGDMEGEALALLVTNCVAKRLKCAVVQAPGIGDGKTEFLKDMAIKTGGEVKIFSAGDQVGEDISKEDLGSCEKIIITSGKTTIIKGRGSKGMINTRIDELKKRKRNTKDEEEKIFLKNRIATLLNGVAVINVGAATALEMKEKIDRVDDALSATRAAIEEGIVPGGGTVLLRCIESLKDLKGDNDDEDKGIDIIRKVIRIPIEQIISNSGKIPGPIVEKVLKTPDPIDYGYNAREEEFGNLYEQGVIDPAKVTRVALQNAASVAGMILTTECVISDPINSGVATN